MKRWIVVILFFLLGYFCDANAINNIAKQKYPYQLLTEDYDILNENDLGGYVWGMNPAPFLGKDSGLNYWQCFPREQVSLVLEDSGLYSEDLGKDTIGDLIIVVQTKPGVSHEYKMRREWTVSDFQKDFNHWRNLMKEEKNVCLGGSFVEHKKWVENDKTKETYEWIFDKIKTKKGCDGYFDDCNRTHKEYLQMVG
jgi:hypothetical protein